MGQPMGTLPIPAPLFVSEPPPIPENPYQLLLYQAVEGAGGRVHAGRERRARVLRGLGPADQAVLHVHWVWIRAGWPESLLRARRYRKLFDLARRRGIPLLWTAHNVEPHEDRRLEREVHDELARSAAGIIVHGAAARTELEHRHQPRCPVAVIPHGHYRAVYAPPPPRAEARARLGIDPGRPLFLSFGQVRPYKGVLDLVSTFADSALDATLLVAGRPADPATAREVARAAGSDPRIRLDLRFIPDHEVPVLFGAADWVVLPFRRITTSGSLILALGFDRPVVLPSVPVLREVAGDDAAEYFEGHADLGFALARALRRDAGAAALAARARADLLDWAPIGVRTVAFAREILGRNA